MAQIAGVFLVTGANGFVGSALCRALAGKGYSVRAAVRSDCHGRSIENIQRLALGEINGRTEWNNALSGVNCVIHLAARTHTADASDAAALALYRQVNVEATRRLAETAARCGTKRIVFVSSIKVNGESTTTHPYSERDAPCPRDAYGVTKWEAEQLLHRLAIDGRIEAVVLRPPLVYGPGVKGNLLQLLRLLERGFPLPLASIRNRRSLIGLDNLVEALIVCACTPAAASKTYLVSDGEDVSTPELALRLGAALGRPAHLFPFPVRLLRVGGKLFHGRGAVERLTNSLQVDSAKIRDDLGWQPRTSLDQGLAKMASWFRDRASN